jgi:hypothetical protein
MDGVFGPPYRDRLHFLEECFLAGRVVGVRLVLSSVEQLKSAHTVRYVSVWLLAMTRICHVDSNDAPKTERKFAFTWNSSLNVCLVIVEKLTHHPKTNRKKLPTRTFGAS